MFFYQGPYSLFYYYKMHFVQNFIFYAFGDSIIFNLYVFINTLNAYKGSISKFY